MKIIILQGRGGVGKTTTLNKVFDELAGPLGYRPAGLRRQLGGDPLDFSEILDGHCKIGIFTMGDYGTPLVEATDDFEQQGCAVMICACNNRVRTQVRLSDKWANYPSETVFKTEDRDHQQAANQQDMRRIIGLIK